MSSPDREKEKALFTKIDDFAKEHNEKGALVEAIHKKLFRLDLTDLAQVNACVDSRIRMKNAKDG